MPDLSESIAESAQAPKSVRVDEVSTEAHPLRDQIAADRYLAEKEAASRAHQGLRFSKVVQPGPV